MCDDDFWPASCSINIKCIKNGFMGQSSQLQETEINFSWFKLKINLLKGFEPFIRLLERLIVGSEKGLEKVKLSSNQNYG